MKKEKKALVLFLMFQGLNGTLTAQENDSIRLLKEVNVTATRYEKSPVETPRSVTVITQEELSKSIYQNVGELLNMQEGIYIVGANQTPGSVQTIFMRGTNSNQTIILLDGVRITDPSSNSNAADLSELSLINVERIEIVRGSHSTLFGSSAIGGVVNIITKKNQKQGIRVDAEANAGTFGQNTATLAQNVVLAYNDTSGFYIAGGIYNQLVNGLDATLDTVTNLAVFKQRDRDNFSKTDYSAKAGFRNNKWDVFAAWKMTTQKTDIDASAYIDDDNYTLDYKRNFFGGSIGYKFNDNIQFRYTGGYSMMNRSAVNDSSVIDAAGTFDHSYYSAEYFGTMATHDAQFSYKGKAIQVVAGGGFYSETMTTSSFYTNTAWMYEAKTDLDTLDLHISTSNFFLQTELNGSMLSKKLKSLNLILGIRNNSNSAFGNQFTYQINPSIAIGKNGLLYGTFSTGFNNPSLYQLYSPEKNYISEIQRGNPTLKPETAKSLEFGFKQALGNNSYLTIALFQNITENAIEYVYLWDKNVGIDTLGNDWMRDDYRGDTYINLGKIKTNGIEISYRSKINDQLFVEANATLINGRMEYDPASIDLSHTDSNHVQLYSNGTFLTKETMALGLVRRPNTARFTLGYSPCKALTLTSTVRFSGTRYDVFYDSGNGPYGALSTTPVGDYTLLDFGVYCQAGKYIGIRLRAENVFDVKYTEINGYTTRGRGFYLSVRFTL